MPNYNRVLLMGNLTRDPEMRFLPSNMPVANFGLAINRRWRNQQGEQQEEVTFVDCEAWSKTAEFINQYFKKGRPIFIEGRLKLDQWQDKEGHNRSKLKVVVENVHFVDSRQGGEEGAPAPAPGSGSGSSGAPGAARRTGAPNRAPGAPGAAPGAAPAATPNSGDPHQPVEEDEIPF